MPNQFFNRLLLIISLFIFNINVASAQFNKIGFPFYKNFERSEYQAGLQSWMISQAPNGIMYFANNEGLMEFDGLNWKLYTVPNRTIIRSVYAGDTGKIYIGCGNDFGYFESDKYGNLDYISLLNLLPESKKDFGEVWKIYNTEEGILFQTYEQIIIYKNNEVEVIPAPKFFHFSFYVNNRFYVTDEKEGVLELINNSLVPLRETQKLIGKEICSILPYKGKLLISTTDNGVYLYNDEKLIEWDTQISDFLKNNQIYCALSIDKDHIAFGTIQNGLIVCTNEGIPVFSANETTGLQNNTILCLAKDAANNLWVGTDNGIDLLYVDLPLSQLSSSQNLSAGYTAILHKGILYLGTNRGLFYKKWDECKKYPESLSDFIRIEAVKGQVWKLQVIDNQLFCGHNNGAYIINNIHAEKITDVPGVWLFMVPEEVDDKIIAGTYTGLILFQKIKGKWVFSRKIQGFEESSRVMEFDEEGNIWMSHVYKGLYHIKFNEAYEDIKSIDFYGRKKGLKTNYEINVSKLKGEIVFLAPDGIYQYDKLSDSIKLSEHYNNLFSYKGIKSILETKNGDIWSFSKNNVAVKRILEDGTYTDIKHPFKPLEGSFIGGFQFVNSIDPNHVLFGSENGFIHYDPEQVTDYKKPFKVFLSQVKLSKTDSVLFKGHMFSGYDFHPVFKYKENNIRFFFSAVNYNFPEKNKFSTFLKGYDTKWSEWENRFDREYTNLKEGDYAFFVKTKNIYDFETNPMVFKFTIQPPWKRTEIAYIIYTFLIILFALIGIYLIKRRLDYIKQKERKRQKQKYIERSKELQRENLIAEKEVIKLRNEQLRQKMKTKNKELADSTMQKIQKNKFLINLKADLNKISSDLNDAPLKNKVKKIIKKIDTDIINENNWKVFEKNFSDVHEEFLTRLKHAYPKISPAELRLCACLRMNISTKEISSLLNISTRGVEAGRYRLRNTLNLDRKINLTDFILSF